MTSGPAVWEPTVKLLFAAPYWVKGDPVRVGAMWNGCMGPYFIELDDYDSVRGNAVLIYRALRNRWMPLGATPDQEWPDAALETLRTWVNQGWRKTEAHPIDSAERIPPPDDRPLPMLIRRDLRSLTQAELDDYRMRVDDAFHVADAAPDAPGQVFFSIHGEWCLHYQEAFLLWHRAYLMQYERHIGCAVPYWNWYAQNGSIDGDPSAGLPQAFKDETYVHPRTGETRPNPLRFAAALKGRSKGNPSSFFVQRDSVLYTTGDDHRAEREKKLGLTRKYQQQVARALGFDVFSTPQGGGYPWANIPSFDPPAPDSDYVYRDQNFDGAYEQPHDNYHGWVGPDMADNAYTAFDPVFWSYHSNIDRMWEIWLRAHPEALFTANTSLRPFAGPRAETLVFDDPRRFAYTTIGDIAKDSRGLGYDFAPPVDPDYVSHDPYTARRAARTEPAGVCPVAAPAQAAAATEPAAIRDELLICFDDVRCTFDSYAIDAFIGLADPKPEHVDARNPHYVGRFSRIGMGVVDDKGRCITHGVTRILDATLNASQLGLAPGDTCELSLLVTRLPDGSAAPEAEIASLPGFRGTIGWYRNSWSVVPRDRHRAEPAGGCCGPAVPPPACHGGGPTIRT
jgi:hypothetical protein